jgi:hypothetical protein
LFVTPDGTGTAARPAVARAQAPALEQRLELRRR